MNDDEIRSSILPFFEERGVSELDLVRSETIFSSGLMDSVDSMSLVLFLDETFGVRFQPFELSLEMLDKMDSIVAAVRRKLS